MFVARIKPGFNWRRGHIMALCLMYSLVFFPANSIAEIGTSTQTSLTENSGQSSAESITEVQTESLAEMPAQTPAQTPAETPDTMPTVSEAAQAPAVPPKTLAQQSPEAPQKAPPTPPIQDVPKPAQKPVSYGPAEDQPEQPAAEQAPQGTAQPPATITPAESTEQTGKAATEPESKETTIAPAAPPESGLTGPDTPQQSAPAKERSTATELKDTDSDIPVSPKQAPVGMDSANQTTTQTDTQAITEATEQTKEKEIRWTDTRPTRVKADWLQLTTGEWLRGRIITMQKETLEFDSDELDLLELDWDKVNYLKSYEPYSLRFDDRVTATGAIEITQDNIIVSTDYDDQEFDRNKLLIIASGKETEISLWSIRMNLGLNLKRGNTDTTDFTSTISAKRRTLLSRLLIDYLGTLSKVGSTDTANSHRLNGTYDIFITRSFFWTMVTSEYYRDTFQNIENRINVGTLLGYTLINNSKTEWDISSGPSYQQTRYISVPQGSPVDSALTLLVNTKFEHELNAMVDLEGNYNVTLGDATTGNYTHHSMLTVETELTERLDLDVSLVWDRVKKPVPDENNISPKQDDFRITVGLAFEL